MLKKYKLVIMIVPALIFNLIPIWLAIKYSSWLWGMGLFVTAPITVGVYALKKLLDQTVGTIVKREK